MDSLGLGQSFKESKPFCENCLKLARKCLAYQGEIDALERRNEELEDELQGIKDDPSVLMEDWSGDLD